MHRRTLLKGGVAFGAALLLPMQTFAAESEKYTSLTRIHPKWKVAKHLTRESLAAAIEGDSKHRVLHPNAAEFILGFAKGRGMPVNTLAELAAFIRSDAVLEADGKRWIPLQVKMGRYGRNSKTVQMNPNPRTDIYPGERVLVWRNEQNGRYEAFISLACANPILLAEPEQPEPTAETTCSVRLWVPAGTDSTGRATLAVRSEDVEVAFACLDESARCNEACTNYLNARDFTTSTLKPSLAAMQDALGHGNIKAIEVDRPEGDIKAGFYIFMKPDIEVWICEGYNLIARLEEA